jgi:hypothetical protein
MGNWEKIIYKGFYDVPRTFIFRHKNMNLLFDCVFDDTLDDYPDNYRVYILPDFSAAELEGSWERLPSRAIRYLGEIPVRMIKFDSTVRREVATETIDEWASRMGWW